MKLTKDLYWKKLAKNLILSFIELLNTWAISYTIQGMDKIDKGNVDKELFTCLVAEFKEEKIEDKVSKKHILKLRNEMATQY